MYHNCPYFHDESLMPGSLCSILEEELESFFLGQNNGPESSAELAHSTELAHNTKLAHSTELAQSTGGLGAVHSYQQREGALRAMVRNMSNLATSVRQHTRDKPDISRRIAHEMLQSIGQAFNDSNELRALDALDRLRSQLQKQPPARQHQLVKKFITPDQSAEAILKVLRGKTGVQKASLEHGLFLVLNRSLDTYESMVYRSVIRSNLPPLIKGLLADAAALREVSEKMEHYFGIRSAGWDYKNGQWQEIPWDIFEQTKQLLDNDPTIMRLANILGRGLSHGNANANAEIAETQHAHEQEYPGAMEIQGIEFGKDIAQLFPSEYTQLTDPETEYRFYKELIDGQLLVSRYRSKERNSELAFRPNQIKKTRGPVIICLDTSGSMIGWPERVAKSLCLALLNVCWKLDRKLYLILFSTEIKELDVSNIDNCLPEFASFLSMEFRGGTDLRPALRASMRKIQEEQYKHADLLIISDFKVPKIMISENRSLDRIRTQSKIHALTIGHSPIDDQFNTFDTQWHYNISSKNVPMGVSI